MLDDLKKAVLEANLQLHQLGLTIFTWGNASGIDRERGMVVIKPSGLAYDAMTAEDMVVVDLNGTQAEGKWRPSSDTPTHLALYHAWPGLGGVVHTHSRWAVSFAQAGQDIPPYGTTHADCFYGPVPCTRPLDTAEIAGNYEAATGSVIVETFRDRHIDPMQVPAALVYSHGPFAWGTSPTDAVYNAAALEQCAFMALQARLLTPDLAPISQALLDRHYLRKHGPGAYYGQG